MGRFFFILLLLYSLPPGLFAQHESKDNIVNPFNVVTNSRAGEGRVTISQSPEIENLMLHHIQTNKNSPGVEGFRVQVFSGTGANGRQEAQDTRSRFLAAFPNDRITVEYRAPFWNVRVGYFRHRHEALPLLRKLRDKFPNSYAVRDAGIAPELFDLHVSDTR